MCATLTAACYPGFACRSGKAVYRCCLSVANWPGVLSVREQRDIAYQLRSLERKHQRVCIVRNDRTYSAWKHSSYAKEPLGKAVAPFQHKVARVENYTVLRYGRAPGVKQRGPGKQSVTRQARAGS